MGSRRGLDVDTFFEVLTGMQEIQLLSEYANKVNWKYPELMEKLVTFINELKIEIIIGQTHKDFMM